MAGRRAVIGGRVMRGAAWAPSADESVTLAALPAAPAHFGPEARAQYVKLISALARRRAIEHADVSLVEMAASAYGEWFRLDRRIHEEDSLLAESEKTGQVFMSGIAQARAAAANAYRRAIADLGVGSPTARAALFDAPQTDFFDALEAPIAAKAAADPYAARTRH